MESITLAEALDKYEPLIVNACQQVWNTAFCGTDYSPCELPDLIQVARLKIIERWPLFNHAGSVAPYMRKTARTAAISYLRDLKRTAPYHPDLAQFAGIAG